MGYIFHFATCIISVIGLYVILKFFNKENLISLYVAFYTIGSGALFFLTALSDQPPASNDFYAWFFWTFAHLIYGYVVGILIRFRYRRKKAKE